MVKEVVEQNRLLPVHLVLSLGMLFITASITNIKVNYCNNYLLNF